MLTSTYLSIAAGAIVSAALLCLCSVSMFGILQQGGYAGGSLVKWYLQKNNMLKKRYSLFTLSLVLLTALFSLCFSFAGAPIANAVSALPFAGMSVLFIYSGRKALKVPLKATPRIVRLAVCYFILLAGIMFGAGVGLAFAAQAIGQEAVSLFRFVPLCLFPLILPFVLVAANTVMKLYEVPHTNKFIRRAAQKLQGSRCVKAGITGSFAKTSVKHYAAQILRQKYSVIATPASYNTPAGIARTVNEKGCDCDIFLAEMGARRVGDIKQLCEMVKPTYGVVTGICPQHLETFGTLENIKAEKGVLAAYADKVVLGETAAELSAKDALIAGRHYGAENVRLSADGTSFDLRLGGEMIAVKTTLLGRHAAEDIAMAAALCLSLGMSVQEISAGIEDIAPVPHRLQKIEGNGLHILDDSYNSNPAGAKDAVEVLKLFGGKKFVVTPGLVELGVLQEQENNSLGAALVGLDGVILVGETQVLAVRRGYLAAGGEEAKLYTVPTLEGASALIAEHLTAGDCVLFLNDLPDIYGK